MKRHFSFILSCVLLFTLLGCSANSKDSLENYKDITTKQIKNVLVETIEKENNTDKSTSQIMNTLKVRYSDEVIKNNNFSFVATYRITLDNEYYYYEMLVSGTLGGDISECKLINYYTEPVS